MFNKPDASTFLTCKDYEIILFCKFMTAGYTTVASFNIHAYVSARQP